jgi:CRISPR-associated protein Cmr2
VSEYTAISFAPVQGFIEKSRKLRDLFGASLILSYLSQQVAEAVDRTENCQVISPALIHVQEGMPNRILVRGRFDRNEVVKALSDAWTTVLEVCRNWVEKHLSFTPAQFDWQLEWDKWQRYTWEIFWGQGETPTAAMQDLERRKLKRDWTGINWTGDSSSLTGTDAIAWHRLGQFDSEPGRSPTPAEKVELQMFYRQLAYVLDNPDRNRAKDTPADERAIEGKYIAANERLSIPELVKRLVTYAPIAQDIGMTKLEEGFAEISREPGQWTGWFMGDGDKVGEALKAIGDDDEAQTAFSEAMRKWGEEFKERFPVDSGRVVYAGGDDFLGIFYRPKLETKISESQARIESQQLAKEAVSWLKQFKQQWQTHGQEITVSMGFVWAANRVPQRDILQHCREAEKQAKNLGRDRVTLRIVFNSGQYIQWTCPWDNLSVLERYLDRDGNQNWTHLYKDWAYLKARHAIRFQDIGKSSVERDLALAMLNLYFEGWQQDISGWKTVAGNNDDAAIVQWVDDLVQVGWQLCSNT